MKSFLDFEEKNVEKAVQKACNELNVSRDKLKYDIISHGSSGIFGLVGTKKALIRVFVPDLSSKQLQSEIFDARPTSGNNKDSKPDDSPLHNDVAALVDEAFGQTRPVVAEQTPEPTAGSKKPKPIAIKHPPRPPRSSRSTAGKPKPSVEKAAVPAAVQNEMTRSFAPSQALPVAEPAPAAPAADPPTPPKNSEAAAAVAMTLSRKILTAMAIEADVSVENGPDACRINVKASEPGVLIGKKGQTLDAIQYLVDKIVAKQCGKGNHILFDVEGYVASRKTELADLAAKLAAKTMKTGKPSTMTRMNAHDRRIVHVSLKSNPLVRTQSVGDGYYRKLIIFPKKKTGKASGLDIQDDAQKE